MSLLVPAYPGCPGSKAIKRSLLLLLLDRSQNYRIFNVRTFNISTPVSYISMVKVGLKKWGNSASLPSLFLPFLSLPLKVLFCSLAVVLSPFIYVLCDSDRLFHGESCPRVDAVHPSRAWPSSPSCTWHCSLHYLFLQAALRSRLP